jgi:hypothetical protein
MSLLVDELRDNNGMRFLKNEILVCEQERILELDEFVLYVEDLDINEESEFMS